MPSKAKASPKPESGPEAPGIGPILRGLLQFLNPLGAAAEHFSSARPELLKGWREIAESRIAQSPPAGPIMTAVLERFGLYGASQGHFNAARLELLKGLVALLDARIAQSSHASPKARGAKLRVI
jgi:hypothetical protein